MVVSSSDENNEIHSVGSWLQSARESRGESLDEASRVTRIGKSYLIAIEQGEMHKLPSEAYAKGFIRLYANHLGLSGDEAVARLSGLQAPATGTRNENIPQPAAVVGTKEVPGSNGYRRWGIPLTLLFFLIVSAIVMRQKGDEPGPRVAVPVVPPQPSPEARITAPSAPPAGEPVTTPPPPAESTDTTVPATKSIQPEGIILRLKAVQTGKLHITIDGAVSQEYDLNVGDLVEWKAEKMFLLDLDNAGSVEGDLNGKPLKPLGEQGRAAHLVIRADGVHTE